MTYQDYINEKFTDDQNASAEALVTILNEFAERLGLDADVFASRSADAIDQITRDMLQGGAQ